MAIYNFWTSQGFIKTSELTKYGRTSSSSQSGIEVNFSELNKYEMPDYSTYTWAQPNTGLTNSNTFKLFGFTRGSDTFELRIAIINRNDNYNGYRIYDIAILVTKNGSTIRFFADESLATTQVWINRNITRPFTHFYITYGTSISSAYGNRTIYDYTIKTINDYGTNYSVPYGSFSIGFGCNISNNNSFQNSNAPSSNGTRIINKVIFIDSGYTSAYTNISEYDTLLEWYFGKNVKYVGDDNISQPGGGFGTGDSSTDNNPIPDTSDTTDFEATNIIMNASGLFTAHIMDTTAITNLVSKLWDTSITTALERLLGTKPLDVIISLKRLPLTLTSSTTKNIYLGTNDTEINTPIVTSQYITVNCGTLYPKEYWGNALDYSPSTKYFIYLPFVGIKSINVDWFQNKEISIKYIIDVLSGDFTCFLQQGETTDTFHQNVVATYTGNCAMQYPLSASDYSSMFIGGMSVLKGAAAGAVFGGSAGAVLGAATSAANTITMKPSYDMTGVYNANMGFCGIMKPYIIIERPIQSLPAQVENYVGFPSNIVSTLSSLTGFTKVQDINLSVNCTLDEKNEIENLLKRGVII